MSGLSLICGDGGVKGGFIAGAVTELIKLFPKQMLNLDVIAASSASVGSMCYLISHGAAHPGHSVWTKELASKEFIDYKSISTFFQERPVYSIDYLVDTVFKKNNPLDVDRILRSPPRFYVPVQNYRTMEVEYFCNGGAGGFSRDGRDIPIHDMGSVDLYEMIRASNSAPFVYDRPVRLNGVEYIDAATIEPFALDLPGMEGTKKIVILTKFNQGIRRRLNYALLGLGWPVAVSPFQTAKFKAGIYHQYARKPVVYDRLEALARKEAAMEKLILVGPTRRIGGMVDNSAETLSDNFCHGEEVVRARRKEFEKLLSC